LYSNAVYDCYLYVQPKLKNLRPDFILIDLFKGICIIEVKDWSLDYIKEINNKYVIDKNGKRLNNPASRANEYLNFAKNILQSEPFLLDGRGLLKFNVYSKVVFPNLHSNEIESLNPTLYQPPIECIGSEQISGLSSDILFSTDTRFLDESIMSTIRGVFFPEIRVKPIQTAIWEFNRKTSPINQIRSTLDAEQEKFARRIPYGHYLITGVPGSGKTVILLARAIHLVQENPMWKIRIVTYNKSLESKLNNRFESLFEDLELRGVNYHNITISTFHALAREIAQITPPPNTTQEYWDIILPFNAIENARPVYDAILIDEYQDFKDPWIKLCLKLCKEHSYNDQLTENLFLAGDRLQSIYYQKDNSWKTLGVNITGRSKILKTSYRSGSTHVNLALNYLMRDEKLKKEVEIFYEGREGICCNYEVDDSIDFIQGNLDHVNEYLNNLLFNQNYNPEDILVLVPKNKGHNSRDEIYQKLDDRLKSICIASKEVEPDKMTVTTYHSSKGLECKVCLLLDVDNLIFNLGEIDDKELMCKKLLYVGLTRASEKLCIHSFSPHKGGVFNELISCYNEIITPFSNEMISCETSDSYFEREETLFVNNLSNAYNSCPKDEGLELVKEVVGSYTSGEIIEEIADSANRQNNRISEKLRESGIISSNIYLANSAVEGHYSEMTTFNESKIIKDKDVEPSSKKEKPYSVKHIHKNYPNAYKSWTKEEELKLIDLYNSGKSIREITNLLGRQNNAIRIRLRKLGVISNKIDSTDNVAGYGTKNPTKSTEFNNDDLTFSHMGTDDLTSFHKETDDLTFSVEKEHSFVHDLLEEGESSNPIKLDASRKDLESTIKPIKAQKGVIKSAIQKLRTFFR
jgi:hypothetical protein